MLRLHPAGSGSLRSACAAGALLAACLGPVSLPRACAAVFVDAEAGGAANGTSWADAFTTLQDALTSAPTGSQIWVAAGTYKPDLGGGHIPGDRLASFVLSGLQLYGGFSGVETALAQRDPAANLTILSGDLLGDDGLGPGGNAENSFHVVTIADGPPLSILDGFTIKGGNANGPGPAGFGGGVLHGAAPLQAATCRFEDNQAVFGGGLYASGGSVSLWNCVLQSNVALQLGGAIHCENVAALMLVNSRLTANGANLGGGAVFMTNLPSAQITSCTITGNASPTGQGGGLLIGAANPQILNTILWANQDSSGSGSQAQIAGGSAVVNFSVVQGGWVGPGMGNLGLDPLFVDPGAGDLQLMTSSPAIDAGHTLLLPEDSLDLDGDLDTTELLPVDLSRAPRVVDHPLAPDAGVPGPGGIVDMGCYEAASGPPADCNGNGVADRQDILLGHSTDCNNNGIPDECELEDCPPGVVGCDDCNNNTVLDECDILSGTSLDLDGNGVPDECVEFIGGCGADIDWSCPANWNLEGLFPNNIGKASYSVTLDATDLCSLDLDITIDTLRIIEDARLLITQPGQRDLTIVEPAGLLLEHELLVAQDHAIDASAGAVVVRSGGLYARDPLAAPGSVSASLAAGSVLVQPGGAVLLSDSMALAVGGDYVLDGSSLTPPCPGCGGKTPPITGGDDDDNVLIEGNLVLMGGVFWTYTSSQFLELHGNFVNHCTTPESYDFSHGSMLLNGPAGQTFEVGGEDLGATLDGFAHPIDGHANFSMGTVDVADDDQAAGVNVTFENVFANVAGTGACSEALYVHTLMLRAGSTILIDDCRVYYETLIDEGGAVQTAGCGQLVELPGCAEDTDCDDGDICFADACVNGTCQYTATLAGCADLDENLVRDDNCLWWSCAGGACDGTAVVFADMGGTFGACDPDGTADANDRYHALNCFADTNTFGSSGYPCEYDPPAAYNVDAGGSFGSCIPDGVCDGHDAFHALNAFAASTSCSCPAPATGPGPAAPRSRPWSFGAVSHPRSAPAAPAGPMVVARAGLRLVASRTIIQPGDSVQVDVFLDGGLSDLRGYQLHVGTAGGSAGQLAIVDLASPSRRAAAFAGHGPWQAFNIRTGQLLCGLDQHGVAVAPGAYLASIVLQASPAARGTFTASLLLAADGGRTFLFPSAPNGMIEITSAVGAPITVAGPAHSVHPPAR